MNYVRILSVVHKTHTQIINRSLDIIIVITHRQVSLCISSRCYHTFKHFIPLLERKCSLFFLFLRCRTSCWWGCLFPGGLSEEIYTHPSNDRIVLSKIKTRGPGILLVVLLFKFMGKIKSVTSQFYCGITPETVKLHMTLFEWGFGSHPQNM